MIKVGVKKSKRQIWEWREYNRFSEDITVTSVTSNMSKHFPEKWSQTYGQTFFREAHDNNMYLVTHMANIKYIICNGNNNNQAF
jgi:hypothetical protein